MHYHPGAMVKNKWTCCQKRGRTTLGCQPTYHLLTRSSSRYAQMRRKDTLTSSTNSQRRARSSSRGSQIDSRSSNAAMTVTSTDAENVPPSKNTETQSGSPAGVGLSNSCMELTSHPPHSEEMFVSTTNTNSRRSSKNSTDHSIGIGSMLLTRVSLTVSEVELEGEMAESHRLSGNISQNSHNTPQFTVRSERGKMNNRSQVAPAWTTSVPVTATCYDRHSFKAEHNTLPRSFKTTSSQHELKRQSQRGVERTDSVGNDDTTPVPPPRLKRGGSSHSHYTPSITPITETSPPPSRQSDTAIGRSRMKHSRTFVTSINTDAQKKVGHKNKFQSKASGISHSMGALTKPLIQPKISSSNPNVIHV